MTRTSRRCYAWRSSGTSPSPATAATADFMISSPLMTGDYDRLVPDYGVYRIRKIDIEEV